MKVLYIILIFLLSFWGYSQNQWYNLTSGKQVNDIVADGENVYLATDGGLCVNNVSTGQLTFYNRGNSLLPTNRIDFIEKGSNGEIWISTNMGISKLENNQIEVITPNISGAILYNEMGLWVASFDSLYLINNEGVDSYPYGNFYYQSTDILEDLDGNIWITAYTFGVFGILRWDGENWGNWDFSNNPGLPFESPVNNQLEMDEAGNVYCLNWGGLYKFENETFFLIETLPNEQILWNFGGLEKTPLGLSTSVMYANGNTHLFSYNGQEWQDQSFNDEFQSQSFLFEAKPNEFYIAFDEEGCFKIDFNDLTNLNFIESSNTVMPTNFVASVTLNQSKIYFANKLFNSNEYVLVSVEDNQVQIVDLPFLNNENILNAQFSPEGDLWIVTPNNIYKYSNAFVESFSKEEIGLSSVSTFVDIVFNPIVFSPKADVWISQGTSIAQYSQEQWHLFTYEDTGLDYEILSLAVDPTSGNVYASYYYYISYYNSFSWQSLNQPQVTNVTASDYNFDISFDESGNLWVAKNTRLVKLDGSTVETFDYTNSNIPQYYTGRSVVSNNGKVWFGGVGEAMLFNGNSWTHFNNNNSGIANGLVNDIKTDSNGNTWFVHSGGGVSVYNPDGVWLNNEKVKFKAENLNIYPNILKAGDTFHVQLPKNVIVSKKMELQIFNNMGSLVNTIDYDPLNSYCTLSMPINLSAGKYFVKLQNEKQWFVGEIMLVE